MSRLRREALARRARLLLAWIAGRWPDEPRGEIEPRRRQKRLFCRNTTLARCGSGPGKAPKPVLTTARRRLRKRERQRGTTGERSWASGRVEDHTGTTRADSFTFGQRRCPLQQGGPPNTSAAVVASWGPIRAGLGTRPMFRVTTMAAARARRPAGGAGARWRRGRPQGGPARAGVRPRAAERQEHSGAAPDHVPGAPGPGHGPAGRPADDGASWHRAMLAGVAIHPDTMPRQDMA